MERNECANALATLSEKKYFKMAKRLAERLTALIENFPPSGLFVQLSVIVDPNAEAALFHEERFYCVLFGTYANQEAPWLMVFANGVGYGEGVSVPFKMWEEIKEELSAAEQCEMELVLHLCRYPETRFRA